MNEHLWSAVKIVAFTLLFSCNWTQLHGNCHIKDEMRFGVGDHCSLFVSWHVVNEMEFRDYGGKKGATFLSSVLPGTLLWRKVGTVLKTNYNYKWNILTSPYVSISFIRYERGMCLYCTRKLYQNDINIFNVRTYSTLPFSFLLRLRGFDTKQGQIII